MAISAEIICDSINRGFWSNSGFEQKRLTTFVLEFPRIILAEFNTHRVFSRNAASSRAIPVAKMIERVKNDPFIPVKWGKNQPGMQAKEEVLNSDDEITARDMWLNARFECVEQAEKLAELGVHKQLVNRLLEPWMWTKVIVSSTEFANFFALRDHPMAEPHMELLAKAMIEAYKASEPKYVDWQDWHLPFISDKEKAKYPNEMLVKFSTARCARVSYLNHDGTKPNLEKDIALHDALVVAKPLHASPAEHQAKAWPGTHGNFTGWVQYRKTLSGENITKLPWEE